MEPQSKSPKIVVKMNFPYLATVAVALLLLFIGHRVATQRTFVFQDDTQEVVRATVQRVLERAPQGGDLGRFEQGEDFWGLEGWDEVGGRDFGDDSYGFANEFDYDFGDFLSMMLMRGEALTFEAEITRGPRRGQIVTASQSFDGFVQDAFREVTAGDSILLITFGEEWFFNGFHRSGRLFILGILFALGVLIFGGKKGFNALLSLGLTCAAVFAVFIPAILSEMNIYLMAILLCVYTTVVTLLIVIGYNKKSLAAAVGCLSGIAITGIIAVVMDRVLFLTGVVDEHSRFLMFLEIDGEINLRAIIFAGIIIGAMGAILDVAMSISSALWEIKKNAQTVSFESLLRSGMTIGRDVFGTMANTLILAYIGTSLSVILLLLVFTDSLTGLLNDERIVVEILQALSGSFGILLTMPLTSLFCATIYVKKGVRRKNKSTAS